jgi:hypothetical protein
MGPIIIFDKSTLESLSPDEAMWLDNFYLANITPLFFVETLADLEKNMRSGRTPEKVVGSLAYKTPDMHSKPNTHHSLLLEAELMAGHKIDMEYGRPHITGGKVTELDGKTGVIFQPSPEEEALSRWEKYDFIALERLFAKRWRKELSNIDLEKNYKLFQKFFPLGKPKIFADVKQFVDFYINGPDQETVLVFGLTLIGVSLSAQDEILARWRAQGKTPIHEFAPYFTHVYSVDLFFNFGVAADLIGRNRPSNKIDIAYLYYLPFCMVFTSNDHLHAKIVPFFLRENQTFISGRDLKADLGKLDKFYDDYPDDVKEQGVTSFAIYPPKDSSFLTAQLWDKHMSPTWRDRDPTFKPRTDSAFAQKIAEEMRQPEKAPPISNGTTFSLDDADHIIIRRSVRARKGKWSRFSPEVLKRNEDEEDAV